MKRYSLHSKKYDVKIRITNDKYISLSITHNGWQWSSIRIDEPEYEIPKMIKVLKDYLKDVTK